MTFNSFAPDLASYLEPILSQFPDKKFEDTQQQHLTTLLQASPFIGRTIQQQPELLFQLTEPAELTKWLQQPFADPLLGIDSEKEPAVFARLRQVRNATLCRIMAADIFKLHSITDNLAAVSALADNLINSAYHWAYRQLIPQWGTPCDQDGTPLPLLILGMGKLGGGELNFSSDIDLIFTYPLNGETQGGKRSVDHQQFFTRLGQKVIAALHQVTADGFVYRVDMRLRPFGDSGPLVLSFAAMEDYYQEQGRDWERYAMLKARVLNPELRYTPELQRMLRPFIYRRYIDFSAIESLRRMKQMIEQENRRRNRNDNIKLGSGGIREVEFIVQTLQLIRGGRIPALQQPAILKALQALQQEGLFTAEQVTQLRQDYLYLRQIEQALQGIDDKQTQTLPADDITRQHLLACLHQTDWTDFENSVTTTMQRVHQQFRLVIGQDESVEEQELSLGKLLWDSELAVEELAIHLNWLTEADAIQLINQLHQFRQECQKRAVGTRGRELLSKLIPHLLHMLQQQKSLPVVMERILVIFKAIVTRTAYIELLYENLPALQQLVLLCTQSGWLTEHLARYPMLLDELIDPSQLYQVATQDDYRDRLRQLLLRVPEENLELLMDTLRQFKQAQQLRIAAADISSVLPLMKVSDHLTWLAEVVVEQIVELAWQQTTERYGKPAGLADNDRGFVVIAYGKLGGLELGYSSDLDLVFLHNCDAVGSTDGDKAIDSRQFYLKLVQRILHLFTTRTNSGVLYDVDTRLRPSGNAGLLAIHIKTYQDYLRNEAWLWEHQALVRARVILGDAVLATEFSAIRQAILATERDLVQLRMEVTEMRDRIRQHHGSDKSDLKHQPGGIVDLEFISQYLVLAYSHRFPALYEYTDNMRILDAVAAAKILPAEQVTALQQAYQLLRGAGHRKTLMPAALPQESSLVQAQTAILQVWQQLFENSLSQK